MASRQISIVMNVRKQYRMGITMKLAHIVMGQVCCR